MHRIRIINKILKKTHANRILGLFVCFVFVVALILLFVEPDINNYGDALWYCYVNLFTIGFGDIVPVTLVGRILSVILTIYATFVIAVVTGVVVTYFSQLLRRQVDEERDNILNQMENLPDMSKEELADLSEKVKKYRLK